jgi:hypothetical protein
MAWTQWLPFVVGLAVASAIAAFGLADYGASRWAEGTRALLLQLEASRVTPVPARYSVQELDGLPAPVQRYFRAVLKDGQPHIAALSADHSGTFNLSESGEQWKPFTSRQHVLMHRPGFVWDGRVAMLPGLPVHVHDAYIAGEGILHPAMLGLFTLLNLRDAGVVAQGELMRFFAEAPWYPTALLPSQGVRWQAIDTQSAKATLADGSITVTLLFRFNQEGLIESVRAEARGRTVGKTIVMTPWEGRWRDYQERDGMRVPLAGEVAWLTPEGRKPYWRGSITSLRYEYAR